MSNFIDTMERIIDNCGLAEAMSTAYNSPSAQTSKYSTQLTKDDEQAMKAASKRVDDGSRDPQDVKLAQTHTRLKTKFDQKIKDLLRKGNYVLSTEAEERPSPILDPENQQQPQDASQPQPQNNNNLTQEGETYLVNLIRKAFFINYSDLDLSEQQLDILTHEVTPQNTTKALQILNNIIETHS